MDKAEIKAKLRTFFCEELIGDPTYPLMDDEPIITGGLIDSFALAYVAVFLEETFGVYIPDADLTTEIFDSLEQIATRIAKEMGNG